MFLRQYFYFVKMNNSIKITVFSSRVPIILEGTPH
uniref:Uncharacterized protein n=1 Tax=Anguilla anguilla TaxID=7936 RepID=A0A0E9QY43_ANGAN